MLMWVTDIHLEFLRFNNKVKKLAKRLESQNPDGLIISGDISTANYIEHQLHDFTQAFTKPIYFVAGNHDFWNSSWKDVNSKLHSLNKKIKNLHWLQEDSPIVFPGFDLVGVGGWYDAYHGNATTSNVALNDFYCVAELIQGAGIPDLLYKIYRDEAGRQADVLYRQLKETTQNTVIIVTHVPPYREATWHEGNISNSHWLPWMSSASTGQAIDRYANNNKDKKIIVLCGHTHSPGIYVRDNVTVYTGKAKHGDPQVAGKIYKDKIVAYNSAGKKVENKI